MIVAPVDGFLKGLLAFRHIAQASGQKLERLSSLAGSAAGGSILTRAAASSMASGKPSSRVQMAAMVNGGCILDVKQSLRSAGCSEAGEGCFH